MKIGKIESNSCMVSIRYSREGGETMYDFSQKIVVITGAAQGIGAAMAERFLKDGAKGVALLDFNAEKLKETVARLDMEQSRTMAVTCDVSDPADVREAFGKVIARFGAVDILINNAGITRDAMSYKMTEEQFDTVLKVSLYGAFYCVQQVVNSMKERGYGRIISMSSIANRGNVGQTNYSSAKAGIVGMTKTLAMELSAKGITVNCIAPGMIHTDIIKTVPEKIQEQMKAQIPMHRFGKPEEVANLAAFLASDEAAYISGQCININGAWQ